MKMVLTSLRARPQEIQMLHHASLEPPLRHLVHFSPLIPHPEAEFPLILQPLLLLLFGGIAPRVGEFLVAVEQEPHSCEVAVGNDNVGGLVVVLVEDAVVEPAGMADAVFAAEVFEDVPGAFGQAGGGRDIFVSCASR